MTSTMALEVLTPDKKVLETIINTMRVLLPDGWWGILPGHAPMIAYFHSGTVHYTKDNKKRYIALYQGTIEVKNDPEERTRIQILTAAAEEGDDLDAVQKELEQQAERLAKLAKEADMEFNQIRISLEKTLQKVDISDIRT
jgi:F-type H+-transporting ATPase subunit epsilon